MTQPPIVKPRRRRSERKALRGVTSPFGQVLNLSLSGACLFRKGAPSLDVGQETRLTIRQEEMDLTLDVRVVRIDKLGLRRSEVGIEFINPDPNQCEMIARLMKRASQDFSPHAWLAA